MNTIQKIKFATIGVTLAFSILIAPVSTKAQTISDLQAQIQNLLAQVAVLQAQLAGTSPVTSSTYFNSDLSLGSSGSQVVALQTTLQSKGFLTVPSGVSMGYFGQATKAAVIKYQTANGVTATGFVGPLTRTILNADRLGGPGPIVTPNPNPTPNPTPNPNPTTGPAQITPDSLPSAYKSQQYVQTLTAQGFSGTRVISWDVVSGALPAGFNIGRITADCPAIYPSTCTNTETFKAAIGGYAQTTGTYTFTIRASDGINSATKSYTLQVSAVGAL